MHCFGVQSLPGGALDDPNPRAPTPSSQALLQASALNLSFHLPLTEGKRDFPRVCSELLSSLQLSHSQRGMRQNQRTCAGGRGGGLRGFWKGLERLLSLECDSLPVLEGY